MATESRENLRTYRPELDAVRFCAFFLVFLEHVFPGSARGFGHYSAEQIFSPSTWKIVVAIDHLCAAGLPLFFALSAYLITGLLLEERELTGQINLRNFYIRRVLRIWPLYFLGLAIGVVFCFVNHTPADLWRFLCYLLMLGNLYAQRVNWTTNPMWPLWSISIEEQFYLFWPCAIKFLSRRWLTIVAVLIIINANLILCFMGQHASSRYLWCDSFVQFEMFAVGILMALHNKVGKNSRWLGSLLVLGALILWFSANYFFLILDSVDRINSPMQNIFGYALMAIGTAAFLKGFLLIGPNPLPRWLPNLGKISYGLYVYHALAVYFVSRIFALFFGSRFPYLAIVFGYLLLLVIAKLSYRYFEKPFLVLKARFEVVHSKPA